MTRPANLDFLDDLIERCEQRVGDAQDDLSRSAAMLAAIVGPMATAHRLAELALEFDKLAKSEE